jgi:hypothetical protein
MRVEQIESGGLEEAGQIVERALGIEAAGVADRGVAFSVQFGDGTSLTRRRAVGLTGWFLISLLIGACAGQPSDLKCSLVPCQMSPPENFTTAQQQAWHDCMTRKANDRPLSLSPVGPTTIPKVQRDYDACVTEASATKP